MNCRSCNGETVRFLDLGHHPPSDAFLTKEQLEGPETYYPLNVHYCSVCGLVQLGYVVPKEVLFTNKYPYLTGSNREGVRHFKNLATNVTRRFSLTNKDLAVDVGSNDGTLLKGFQDEGVRVLGVEPCENLALQACGAGIPTICAWFRKDITTKNAMLGAKVITACNVFAHVEDVNGFVGTVKSFLAQDGVFIIESPYLLDTIDSLEYDTIYHEHLYYWSYLPLQRLLGRYGLEVFDMEKQGVHGGTMRYYIGHTGAHDRVRHRVVSVRDNEKKVDIDYLLDFADNVEAHKKDLNDLIGRIRQKGKRVVGMSAPAKGNTLINYCNLKLDYIAETNPLKIGKYTPGAHIPVINENGYDGIDYALIFAWNWKDQIIENNQGFVKKGGRFIVPIPEPRIEHLGSGVWASYEL